MFDPEPPLPRVQSPGPSRLLTNLPILCASLNCTVERTALGGGQHLYWHLSFATDRDRITLFHPDYPDGPAEVLLVWVTELHRRVGSA